MSTVDKENSQNGSQNISMNDKNSFKSDGLSEADVAKAEELKTKANELFKGIL